MARNATEALDVLLLAEQVANIYWVRGTGVSVVDQVWANNMNIFEKAPATEDTLFVAPATI
jgi:hypothetical protein